MRGVDLGDALGNWLFLAGVAVGAAGVLIGFILGWAFT